MIVLGALYFFSKTFAQDSPIFNFLSSNASVAFGNEMGLSAFFLLLIVIGTLILIKGYLMKTLIKRFFVIMILISAILNFRILEKTVEHYPKAGGYFSRPLLRVLQYAFGAESILAIKIIVVLLLVISLGYVLYVFNVRLPKLPKINIQTTSRAPQKKQKEKSRPTITISSPDLSVAEMVKNIAPSKASVQTGSSSAASGSLIKEIFKAKVHAKVEEKKPKPLIQFAGDKPTFPSSLLGPNSDPHTIDEKFLIEKAESLQAKLAEFGVPIQIKGFDIGPSIVQIKIQPEEGIRISAIENLTNDIKLSLKSKSLRIIAPIPGTDLVGIQIPNPRPNLVKLPDVLNTSQFSKAMEESSTNLSVGIGIDGSIQTKTLEKMPHLLVAGSTGSGKSVGLNNFIVSLMYQNTPSELKFLMVDPKQVELAMYSGLPYLLAPIVYDSGKAIKLLQWTVDEMESRYTLLKNERVKNIDEYNAKNPTEKMYRIVFVIDEMADMMLSSAANRKEVENSINRLAAKARAIGIHLILATQRPSVNVITGLIKANIPTRIAFSVVSEIDSRTILGRKGAEDLVGKGDLLYMDPSTKFPIRMQAPFIATDEIDRVVAHLRNKYMEGLSEEDIYHPEIIAALESKLETARMGGSGDAGDDEALVNQAIQVILETRKASATLLQRKLNVGFARAARIMDILEERGVIGPQDGAKPRDIFI